MCGIQSKIIRHAKKSSMGRKLTTIDPALIQILELAVKDIKTVTVTEVYLPKELDGNMKKF